MPTPLPLGARLDDVDGKRRRLHYRRPGSTGCRPPLLHRGRRAPDRGGQVKISLLLSSAYGMRGDVRVHPEPRHRAGRAARRRGHQRQAAQGEALLPRRAQGGAALRGRRPARGRHLLPRGQMRTEVALWRVLRDLKADVLITTRPGLSVQAARHAPRDMVSSPGSGRARPIPGPSRRFYPRLDAVVTATETSRRRSGAGCWARGRPCSVVPDALPRRARGRARGWTTASSRRADGGCPVKAYDTADPRVRHRRPTSAPTGGCGCTAAAPRRSGCGRWSGSSTCTTTSTSWAPRRTWRASSPRRRSWPTPRTAAVSA